MSRVLSWMLGALLLVLTAYLAWWWPTHMERKLESVPRFSNLLKEDDPLAAAAGFLRARGLKTDSRPTLHGLAGQPGAHDTVLTQEIPDSLPPSEQRWWHDWIMHGGVLITAVAPDDSADELPDQNTLIAPLHLGASERTASAPVKRAVTPPDSAYALHLRAPSFYDLKPSPVLPPAWHDQPVGALLAYRMGQGWLIVLNSANVFDIQHLPYLDHAELLWRLAELNHGKVWFAQAGAPTAWYVRLWQKWPAALLVLALLLVVALWRSGARFGPLLLEPGGQRRALLEHIRASARWGWRHDGRTQLLQTARRTTLSLIAARLPEWSRLPPNELARRLAERAQLPVADVDAALNRAAPTHPAAFAHVVATLQTLRNTL